MPAVELTSSSPARSPWLVLLTPSASFRRVAHHPHPWLTLVVVGAIAALPVLVFVSLVDMHAFLLAELKASGRLEEMPPEALALMKERIAPAMTWGLPLAAALKRAATILLVGALGFAFLRGMTSRRGESDLRFTTCLAAVALGAAPLLLHDVGSALILASRDLSHVDVRNPVLSNPSAWLGLHVEKDPLGALLYSVDLFKLWSAWLSAYGLNVVAGTRSLLPYALTYGGQTLATLAAVVGAAAQ